LKSVSEILPLAIQYLTDHQIENPRRCAEELLAHILKMKRIELYMQYDRPLIEKEVVEMRNALKRCANREPIQYVMGDVEFLGCHIDVTPDVLIPRHETEIMADLIVNKIKNQSLNGKVLWDICAGSGCLGLAIKRAYPELTVVLSDISKPAIEVAKKNQQRNSLDANYRIGDLFEPFQNEKADFLVCNPPYISTEEMAALESSVRDYEPHLALHGGERGIEFYERLSREMPAYLNHSAQVFFEIGHQQGVMIQEMFCTSPWRHGQLLKDWAGHNRFFFLEIE
jgi:release factor glutamine methyltransferase